MLPEIVEIDWATLDPREVATAVEYLIEHTDEAKEMGRNGQEAVLEKYNWEKETKELLELYEEGTKRFPFGS